jgi:hypothetical protein
MYVTVTKTHCFQTAYAHPMFLRDRVNASLPSATETLRFAGIDVLEGADGKQLGAMQFIAAYAHSAGAEGRFDAQTRASNETNWEMTA